MPLARSAKDVGCEDVAAHDREVAWGFFGGRLFDHPSEFVEARANVLRPRRYRTWKSRRGVPNQRNDRRVVGFGDIEKLAQAWARAVEDVVGQDHGKGLVTDGVAGLENGVAEAERLRLISYGELGEIVGVMDNFE